MQVSVKIRNEGFIMNKNIIILLLLFPVIILATCTPFQVDELETTTVTLNTGINPAGSRVAATDVDSFKLTVTAEGMTAVEKVFTGDSISLEIDAGYSRIFTLQALDSDGNILFSGSSSADLEAGKTLTLVIELDYAGYYVTFITNGAGTLETQYVTAGGTVVEPAALIRTGYTFAEWYTDMALTTQWIFSSDTVSSDMFLYANWTAKTYSIIFDGNGFSSGSMSDLSVDYNETVTLTSNGYLLTGYNFTGWNTASNGSGTTYNENADYTHVIDGNITLYAQWQAPQGLNFIQTDTLGSTSPYTGWNWTRYNDTVNSNSYLIIPNSSAAYYAIEVTDGTETVFTSIQLYDTGNWSTATINFYAFVDGVQTGSETYSGDVPYATGGYNHTFSDSAFSNADMIVIQPLQSDGTTPTPICLDDVITDLFGTIDFESTTGLSGTGTPTVNYTP